MGHKWRNVTVPELVHWTGVPIRHWALDGKVGTIFAHWNADDPCYNSAIAKSMTCEHWKKHQTFLQAEQQFAEQTAWN